MQAQRSTQETSRLRLHGHALEQGVELHWVRSPRLVVDAQTGASGLSLKVWYDAVRRLAGKRCQGYKGAMTASNLLHFWGTPLLFPTVALAAFSLASVPWKRKALHFLLAAWLAWVAAFPVIDVAIRLHRNPEAPGDWHLADVFVHLCLWASILLPFWIFVTIPNELQAARACLRLLIPAGIPILLNGVYSPLNEWWLVKRFGCGCKLDGINANTITFYFFLLTAVCGVVAAFMVSRHLPWRFRAVHWAIIIPIVLFLSRMMADSNCWL